MLAVVERAHGDIGGASAGAAAIADVTAQKLAAEARNRLEQLLAELLQLKTRLRAAAPSCP
jgi:hypothetical protein